MNNIYKLILILQLIAVKCLIAYTISDRIVPNLHKNLNQKFYDVKVTYKDSRAIDRIYDLISQGDAVGPDRLGVQTDLHLTVTERGLNVLQADPFVDVKRQELSQLTTTRRPKTLLLRNSDYADEFNEDEFDSEIDNELDIDDRSNGESMKVFGTFFDDYQRYSTMMSFLQQVQAIYPNLVELEKIGTSFEGRDLMMVKISGENGNCKQKPIIWIDAGIHAREWIAPMTGFYLISKLTSEYSNNTDIKSLVDSYDWHILPLVNPDGYEYTHTTSRMWRKTRSRKSETDTCVGVDGNRNFGYKWMHSGASSHKCSEIYAGPSAFSEPETRAVRDYLLKFKQNNNSSQVAAYLTFHAYSEVWLYPWGFDTSVPNHSNDLDKLARIATSQMRKRNAYQVGPSGKLLYPAAGGSDDWALAEANIKFCYTIELSPSQNAGSTGFKLPKNRIKPVGADILRAIQGLSHGLRSYLPNTCQT